MRDDDFREFVTAASPALSRSAYLLTGDHHLAEDLLQSALANAYRHWGRVTSNPAAYVRRSMYHEHVSRYRRRRVREYPADWLPEPATTRDVADETSERVALAQALKKLSPRQRAIMVLRFYEDLTEAETARTLGCTVGTVKRHGHEALARLREVMRAQAAQAAPYDVHERSIATAKRRDRIRLATATGLALVLVALVMAGIGLAPAVRMWAPAEPGPVSLPDRVAAPPRFYLEATTSPPGPAAVLIGGVGWGMPLTSDGDLAVVGSTSDTYRTILDEASSVAGRQALLSPDGRKVARHTFSGLRITDLTTGDEKTYFSAEFVSAPAAWSRDSTILGVSVFQNPGGYLALLDLNTGQVRTIYVSALAPDGVVGWSMAFSPDGSRFAYSRDGQVVVTGMDLAEQSRFTLPPGAFLAGKGAWTPDGSGVAIVQPDGRGWRLNVFDLNTGSFRPQSWTGGRDMAAMRLMGWSPDAEPVVAAYFAHPGSESSAALGTANSNNALATAEVLALTAHGPRTLITASAQVKSIDVSEDAIATGRIRNSSPPIIGPVSIGLVLLTLALAALIARSLRRRRTRARHTADRRGRHPALG